MRNKITYLGWTFNAKKIARATIGLEQSLPILTLGIDTFECEVKCPDKSILQFDQNTPLCYFHREKQMGIYYVQSIERVSPDHYSFAAISTLGLLEQVTFYGGIYTGETVNDVVASICGNIPFTVATELQETKLYGWLGITTARAALRQVLFAIGANLTTDDDGALHIEILSARVQGTIGRDRIYADGASVENLGPVTSFTVLEHQYTPGAERKDLYEGATLQGQRIPFDEPVSSLLAEGFTILESGANYAIVSAGGGKLTGIPYLHTTSEVTRPVTSAPVPNDERIEDATLVSLVNSNAVADRMAAYYACREVIHASAVIQTERPGQVVEFYHPFDGNLVQAAISDSSVEVSGVLKADLSALIGFKPYGGTGETFNHVETITEEKDFVVPPNVHLIRAVVIQGGSGGESGLSGGEAETGQQSSSSVSNSTTITLMAKGGGKGGEAGAGGLPGKVLVVDINVIPGQIFHALPGVAGVGGKVGSDPKTHYPGTEGTHSTFGNYTSADGSILPGGWLEIISGETLAAPGRTGLKGGDGSGLDDQQNVVPGDAVTDGETSYQPGESYFEPTASLSVGNWQTGYGSYNGTVTGSLGGGAAYGSDGKPGRVAYVKNYDGESDLRWGKRSDTGYVLWKEPPDVMTAHIRPGGAGADAQPFPVPTAMGAGGPGGNGGGGQGAPSSAMLRNAYDKNITKGNLWFWGPYIGDIHVGAPSDGTDGAPGGILVYYHVEEEEGGATQ